MTVCHQCNTLIEYRKRAVKRKRIRKSDNFNMKAIHLDKALVEVEWLNKNLGAEHLIVLDATLPKAVAAGVKEEAPVGRIPGARFFDIKNHMT